jgi:hypothetical protein
MANDIVEGLKNTVRYLPQNVIQGVLGQNIGHKVEGWLGMPLGPDPQGNIYQEPGQVDPDYPRQMLENANRSFQQQQAQPVAPQPPRRMMPQR